MRKSLSFLLLLLLAASSCNNDPEPGPSPEEDRAYISLYNFLSEPFDIKWEVDEVELTESQPYGSLFSGGVLLDEDLEEILFVVKNGESNVYLESQLLTMEKGKYYLVGVLGTSENPLLICEELETSAPSSGKVHSRFLHAAVDEDPLDIYMGGNTPEKQVLSGLDYGQISAYDEVSEYDIRASVIVTLHDTVYKEENELIRFEYNDLIQVNSNNLSVIAPASNIDSSSLNVWLYPQPKE